MKHPGSGRRPVKPKNPSSSGSGRRGSGQLREHDREAGFHTGNAGYVNRPLMGFHSPANNRKAKSGTFDLLGMRRFHPVKTIENVRQMGNGNPDAIVRDADDRFAVPDARLDGNGQARLQVLLDGVFNEVEEDLRPIEHVTIDHERSAIQFDADGSLFFMSHCLQTANDILYAGAEVKESTFEKVLRIFQFGNHEHVFHNPDDTLAVSLHHAQNAFAHGGIGGDIVVLKKVFQIAVDDRQGSPQLVGGIGHKVPANSHRPVFLGNIVKKDTDLVEIFLQGSGDDLKNLLRTGTALPFSDRNGNFLTDGIAVAKDFPVELVECFVLGRKEDIASDTARFTQKYACRSVGDQNPSVPVSYEKCVTHGF